MIAQQIFGIGEIAKNSKKYTLAIPWLELALKKLWEDKEHDNTNSMNFVSGLLRATIMEVKKNLFKLAFNV